MDINETKEIIAGLPDGEDLYYWDKEGQVWLPEPEDCVVTDGLKALADDHTALKERLAAANKGAQTNARVNELLVKRIAALQGETGAAAR